MQGSRMSIWKRIAAIVIGSLLCYLLAAFCTVNVGQIRISIDQLPVLLLAIICGPIESAITAIIGSAVYQIQNYGFSWMIIPWTISYTLRGIIVGYGCRYLTKRNDDKPWKRPVQFMALLCFAAVVTTVMNTALIWIDASQNGMFSMTLVFDNFYTRLFISTFVSVTIGLVLPPISEAAERRISRAHT